MMTPARLSCLLGLPLLSACGGGPWLVSLTLENTSQPGDLVASDGSSHDFKLAPGLVILHDADFSLFSTGAVASSALEAIAEDGDPSLLIASLSAREDVFWFEVVSTLDGETYDDAPLSPGDVVTVTSTAAARGDGLTFVQMFGESNDIFLATTSPLEIGPDLAGEQVQHIAYFDAGTEVNQEPGLGADQAPRQAAPGDGTPEDGTISALSQEVDAAGWSYPPLDQLLSLSLSLTLEEDAAQ